MLTPSKDFFTEIDDFVNLYENGTITIVDGIEFSMRQEVKDTTYYILSRYIGGQIDQQKRRKPFMNIGNAIVDIEWRAKNIDRKAIVASPKDGDYVFAMMFNRELQQYMEDSKFGIYINDHQRKKSEYGSVLLKKTEDSDSLTIDVVKWNNVCVNAKDISGGIKLEKFEMSPLELRKKSGAWEEAVIEEVIFAHKKERNPNKDIEVWDIEGEFPDNYFEEHAEAKGNKTAIYNVIVAVVDKKKYRLYVTKLSETRFKHFKRKSVENRDYGIGVWEEVKEPQIWTNEAVIAEKFAMDLAGKVIIKTTLKTDIPSAANLLDGEMIQLNKPDDIFEAVSLVPSALPQHQNTIDRWFLNTQRDQSTFNAVTGEEGNSGTPFAAQALQAAQGGSIFNMRRDQDGFDFEEVVVDWVVPFLVKRINKAHTLTAAYSPKELKMIDRAVRVEMGNNALDSLIQNEEAEINPETIGAVGVQVDEFLAENKERAVEIPKGYFTVEKVKTKLRFNITDEMEDSQKKLNTLAVALQNLPANAPERTAIVQEMMQIGGSSPITFGVGSSAPTQSAGSVDPRTVAAQPSKVEAVLPAGQR